MSRPRVAATLLLVGQLACRPVFAIGWEEILAIGLITALLLGPLFFRLARFWAKFQESSKKDGK